MNHKVKSSNFNSIRGVSGIACIAIWTLLSATATQANPNTVNLLDIQTAAHVAQLNDPWLVRNKHAQDSLESLSIASGTMPDPKVSLALANVPTDTFDFDQEAMTQVKVGVTQMIPRGDTLDLTKKQLEVFSTQFPHQRQDRKATVAVMVSRLWLDAFKAQESISLIEKDRPLFEQLADVAEASYSAALGKTRQQDIIRAQLELTRLDDRLTRLRQKQDMAMEGLAGWLNDNFAQHYLSSNTDHLLVSTGPTLMLENTLPNTRMLNRKLFTSPTDNDPQELYTYFSKHPAVLNLDQKIKATDLGVDLAKQKYKPEWGVNASYGYRDDAQNGSSRADFLSVGITFDVPLFTANRQDRQLDSAKSKALSIGTEKWLLLRKMIADFEKLRVQLLRLDERETLYMQNLLPQMHEQAEASLTAYTNDDGDFAEVVRSRIAELNAQIDALNIRVERQKTIVQMNYYFMKDPSEVISNDTTGGDER